MSRKTPATRDSQADAPCQLYLAVRPSADSSATVEKLSAILRQVSMPSLLIEPRCGETLSATSVLPLIEIAQQNGVAVMIADDAALARSARADGVHLTSSPDILDRLQKAREISGGTLMLGADAGASRHDAMLIGESGTDYVAFGIPPTTRDLTEAIASRFQMIEWWSKVFEVPCVAAGLDNDETAAAIALAEAGADFACVRMPEGMATPDLIEWASTLKHELGASGGREQAA